MTMKFTSWLPARKATAPAATSEIDVIIDSLSPEDYAAAERKLVRKIDFRIMPCLFTIIILK